MWVRFGGKCKFLHHIAASQVVAATSINDQATRTFFNDTLCLKQCMSLIWFRLLHLCTKHTLHNEALIILCILCTNLLLLSFLTTCMVSSKQSECIFIKITSRGIPTIFFDHQNTLARTVTLHVSKALASMALEHLLFYPWMQPKRH